MELKGFYFPRSVIKIHHYYYTSSSSEVIYIKIKLPKESSLGESIKLLKESLLSNRVKLLRESLLGNRVKLLKESSLGDRVEMPRDFPFILYLQRYSIGQLSPIREELLFLVNTSTKPFYI